MEMINHFRENQYPLIITLMLINLLIPNISAFTAIYMLCYKPILYDIERYKAVCDSSPMNDTTIPVAQYVSFSTIRYGNLTLA